MMIVLSGQKKPVLNPENLPPLVLAYLGDAVYELMVRCYLVEKGVKKVSDLHKKAVEYVRAQTQAKAMRFLKDSLNEIETAVARRGRNAKGGQPPKGAGVVDYRLSTGLESFIGYLFLKGEYDRLNQVMLEIGRLVERDGENEKELP